MKVAYKNSFGRKVSMDLSELLEIRMDDWSGDAEGIIESIQKDVTKVKTFLRRLTEILTAKGALSVSEVGELIGNKDLKEVRENDILD